MRLTPVTALFDNIAQQRRPNPHGRQRRRSSVASVEEFRVGPTMIAVDHRFTIAIQVTAGWFGQINYHITDQFELQVGARYSTFRVDGLGSVVIGSGIPTFPPGGLEVANLSGCHNDDRPTGKVALNYTLDENNLLYAFVARGYKPGEFNSATSDRARDCHGLRKGLEVDFRRANSNAFGPGLLPCFYETSAYRPMYRQDPADKPLAE